jgi:hypothetical protein
MKIKALCSSEPSVDFHWATQHYIPKDITLNDVLFKNQNWLANIRTWLSSSLTGKGAGKRDRRKVKISPSATVVMKGTLAFIAFIGAISSNLPHPYLFFFL